ncbi:gamma-glutamylcyclotransferase [Geodermatophilus sp. SYSU D00867]
MTRPPTTGPDAVFVYGTLKPGRSRWPVLAPFADAMTGAWETSVRGRLWDTGHGWPAMTAGDGEVRGVLVPLRTSRTTDALALLDAIEGVATGLFERIRVTTAEGTTCWTYRWPGATAGFVPVEGAW